MTYLTYPSVPNLVITWVLGLGDLLPAPVESSTALPLAYEQHLPFVRVARIGGSKEYGIDRARVRLEVFASNYDTAESIALALETAIEWDLPNFTDGDGRVIETDLISGMDQTYWDDEGVTRFMGTSGVVVGAQH